MITTEQKQRAKEFQALHNNKEMLLLPNAWNAGSAKVFEKEGFKAVATTSAGIAFAMGYADGEIIDIEDLCLVSQQITRRISIPLSVDLERGYSDNPKEVKKNVRKILETGAVGINLEDGRPDGKLDSLNLLLDKIKAIAELKKELDLSFVINARTCTYWLNVGSEEEKLNTTIERCNAFLKAGADCVFVPGLLQKETLVELLANINGPLNAIANPVYHDLKEMEQLGISRLSLGSGPVRAMYAKLIQNSKEIIENSDISSLLNHDFSYAAANKYFAE